MKIAYLAAAFVLGLSVMWWMAYSMAFFRGWWSFPASLTGAYALLALVVLCISRAMKRPDK